MGERTAARRGVGGWPAAGSRVGAWIAGGLARLRADLAPPAMNRRILHRLAVMSDAELLSLGLAREDVRAAARGDVADVAGFLVARRARRRHVPGLDACRSI